MKTHCILAALLVPAIPSFGQTTLSDVHADVGVAYEDGAWDLHIHDEDNDVEYEPDEATLQLNASTETTVSSDPLFSFLGNPGDPTWILPAIEQPGLLLLGLGAEEVEAGTFVGDTVNVFLRGVSGPGNFSTFVLDGITGNPNVIMDSSDGFDNTDMFVVPAGGHSELNWAFSAAGDYTVSFEAEGTLVDGKVFTTSGPVDYSFHVVPEPSTWALMSLGIGGAFFLARRRARK